MSQSIRVLVVDDETAIRRFLRAGLQGHGYEVVESPNGRDALDKVTGVKPDMMILDLGLPDLDGVEVIRQVREWNRLPIIVLSVRDREEDKIAALDAGADDYLTKPFGIGELMARLRAALRHEMPADGEPVFEIGELRVDLAQHQVTVGGRELKLTPTEYGILRVLVKNSGRVVTHRQLLREVWGPGYETESHYVRVYVGQLRQKMESDPTRPQYILTEPGVGYRLRVQATS